MSKLCIKTLSIEVCKSFTIKYCKTLKIETLHQLRNLIVDFSILMVKTIL